MNELQTFVSDKFGEIRTTVIDGEPWFVGKDVAEALGYKKARNAISVHVDDEDKGALNQGTLGGMQSMTIINESGLYALIFGSKLESAKDFKHWVTSEILPTIRKTGGYGNGQLINDNGSINTLAIRQICDRLDKLELENAVQSQQIAEMRPKATYYDFVLKSPGLTNTTVIAKDYGMSTVKFNLLLHDLGIQYKRGGTWFLYQKYADKGYTKSDTYPIGEHVKYCMKWTQAGRLFLYNTLKEYGYLPLMEKQQRFELEETA